MSLAGSGRKGSRRGGRRAPMAEINVTPFVDVMLVLLIIFMVTAPLLNSGVPIELPDSRANALPAEQDPITLTVAPDGAIYLGDEALAAGSLPARLADIRPLADGTMPQINLRGDRTQSYGRMMAVMGELNRAGFNSIALLANDVAAAPEAIVTGGDTAPAEVTDVTAVSDGSDSEQ